ncbi:MAG: M20/M25/M40 family metallo-hydrolase [Planctomycetaceae bacterium]
MIHRVFAQFKLPFAAAVVVSLWLWPIGNATAADALSFDAALGRIRGSDLQKTVNVLASDTFEGRESGSRGGIAAATFIIEQLRKLPVRPGGDDGSYAQHFGNGYRNILVVLPGSDAGKKQEYLLVGAHYDHVGYGNATNSLGPTGYIHNGADDNASGTSGLLELIEAFTSLPAPPSRSIVFVFWDAEERGLLGSEHWVAAPTVPLSQLRMVFNMDMIGRLRDQRLEVSGVRTAAGLRRLLCEQNRDMNLTLDFNWTTIRESDHYPFYERRIPFLMLHSGKHEDYHRPTDDVDKINREGMASIIRLLFRTVYTAAEMPELPRFRSESMQETQFHHQQADRPLAPEPTRLGVSWDAKLAIKGEIRLDRVDPGSPAAAAGLKVGDRIVKFGDYRTDGADDFRSIVLAAPSPVAIVVEREGSESPVEATVRLNGRPRSIGMSWHYDPAEPTSVIVTRVDPGSPADHAGLRPADRIYSVDGKPFASSREFSALIASHDAFSLTTERAGRVREVHIALLKPPSEE